VDYTTTDGITVIEGLEAVRRRPVMYIGGEEPGRSLRARLLELVLDGVARDTPQPREIRVALWRDGAMAVRTTAIRSPSSRSTCPRRELRIHTSINSFSVSTPGRTPVVTLLARTQCAKPFGTTWLTFCPDESVIPGGPLSERDARAAADRVAHRAADVAVVVHDRSTDLADWY
jgi:hypothetical protein